MNYLNKLLSVIGVILLGAIGSGVWENVLKPVTYATKDVMLSLITLNIKYFQDSIYKEIARGLNDKTSLASYSLSTVVITLVIACIVFVLISIHHTNLKFNKLYSILDESKVVDFEEYRPAFFKLFDKVMPTKKAKPSMFKAAMIFYYMTIFFVVFMQLNLARYSYINKSITTYNQLLKIVVPYIPTDQKTLYDSKFSQIKSKNDYDEIISSISQIAINNKCSLPDR